MCGCDPTNVGGTSLAQRLDVEHALLQVRMHPTPPRRPRALKHALLLRLPVRRARRRPRPASPACDRRLVVPDRCVEQHVQIAPPALARDVSVVRGGDEADCLRRACVQVASSVRPLLNRVCVERVLVVHNDVVCCLDVPLQAIVRLIEFMRQWRHLMQGSKSRVSQRSYLEIEVKVVRVGYAFVDDGAWLRVAVLGGMRTVDRPEPGVMAFPADDDTEPRFVGRRGRDHFECSLKLWKLYPEDMVVLSLEEE